MIETTSPLPQMNDRTDRAPLSLRRGGLLVSRHIEFGWGEVILAIRIGKQEVLGENGAGV